MSLLRFLCLDVKYFCERSIAMPMMRKPATVTSTAESAMRHSVTNIIMRQPANCAAELMMDGRLLDSAC